MKTKQVVDLYFGRAYKTLEEEFNRALGVICDEDPRVQSVRAALRGLNETVKETGGQLFSMTTHRELGYLTEESKAKVEKISEKTIAEREQLDRVRQDIDALLPSCESFADEVCVLSAYGILESRREGYPKRIGEYTVTF